MYWSKEKKPKIHMIGIGGSGMCGIAEILLASGFRVSGSDLSESAVIRRLKELGAEIFMGHHAEQVKGSDCVVVSSAIPLKNPEFQEAKKRRIPVIPRAEMLAELMRLKRGVAVAGSHGKTTTTCILGQILKPLKPTVVVGGQVQQWNASSILGRSSIFVVEADESDRSFLKFSPVYSLVTNIDLEHLDNYRDLSDVEGAFEGFLNQTAFFGEAWLNANCPQSMRVRESALKPTRLYGEGSSCDLEISQVALHSDHSLFHLSLQGESLGEFKLPLPGKHNVWNATGAIGIALSLGVGVNSIRRQLSSVVGAERRLERHFENEAYAVVEDYAHHPTELRAALESLRLMYPGRRLHVIFQPHRYSRTSALWKEFLEVFPKACDRLDVLPIYSAHEPPIEGVSSEALVKAWGREEFQYLPELQDPLELATLIQEQHSSAVVAVLGAGPLTAYTKELARQFKARTQVFSAN